MGTKIADLVTRTGSGCQGPPWRHFADSGISLRHVKESGMTVLRIPLRRAPDAPAQGGPDLTADGRSAAKAAVFALRKHAGISFFSQESGDAG